MQIIYFIHYWGKMYANHIFFIIGAKCMQIIFFSLLEQNVCKSYIFSLLGRNVCKSYDLHTFRPNNEKICHLEGSLIAGI